MNRQVAKERALELVGKMTIEEVTSQLRYNAPAIDRLGIPAYNWWCEALHGVARAGTATSFPQAIGMAAAFDEELMEEIGDVISEEGRAKYNAYSRCEDRDIYKGLTFWSPNINIFRDPRWGRGQETYGEDPFLSGKLGCSFVKGLQGDGEYMKAAACAKHFAVHSGPEAIRHSFDVKTSEKDLRETYLPAFEMLVKDAGVEAVMGTYNRLNGIPTSAHPHLIREILRGEWGFEGHCVSDCWAIRDFHEGHKVTSSPEESAALAMNAGCDLNCGSTYLHLYDAWKQGLITEDRLREAAVRLFTTRFLLGLFDETELDDIPYTVLECPEHLALAEKAAEEGIVLLKNDGILPLDPAKVRTIGVVGPNANSRAALVGNYHGTATEYITPLDGILHYTQKYNCEHVSENGALEDQKIRVLYSDGCDIVDDRIEKLAFENDRISEAMIVAEHSDVVVVFVGLNETLEGEEGDTGNSYASGDKTDLLLPASQRTLLHALEETGKPVVLCLIAGSAIDLTYADEHFNAVMTAWYPGARGGEAIAKILFGEVSPSGKLPVTFYRDSDPLPDFEDYSMKGRTYRYIDYAPLYPFGYGLTYGDVEVTQAAFGRNDSGLPEVCVKAENKGECGTKEVIQVYVKYEDDQNATPNAGLCGFKKVFVPAGEIISVRIPLDAKIGTVIDSEGNRVPAAGSTQLFVGTGQPDERTCRLSGGKNVIRVPLE